MKPMWASVAAAALGAVIVMNASGAAAATVTRNVNFTATEFQNTTGNPLAAPFDPVTGSFTIVFDDALSVTDQTAGITLSGINILMGSDLAFNYDAANDTLAVGGLENGAANANYGPATDDFTMQFSNFLSDTPVVTFFAYAQIAAGDIAFYTFGADIDVTDPNNPGSPPVSAVPLPAGLPLLLSGLAAIGLIRRRSAA
ncbi:MAG: VPLPA-CTERM sorting domain-containing protein [Pikeienuella sp.]